jgi:unsaturated rhamnogalacturonyl hydrolase
LGSIEPKEFVVRKVLPFLLIPLALVATTLAQTAQPAGSPARKMAHTVIAQWPAGVVSTIKTPGQWGYEEGVLLDGIGAEWHTTADGSDFTYVKAAVDKYISADGTIKDYKGEGHTLDDIEMGRAVLLVYRVTQQEKYAKAARFLHDQLALQPRTPSGAYWHKQIYPNQVWLDGAYMAEPFRAMYAATFLVDDWDDIAKQFLIMADHMRDPKTGLLRHGWDESKQMPWADKSTGLSPEVWGRAMGWYCMGLVDTLDWFPENNPQRARLVAVLQQTLKHVVQYQDQETGLWWQVMTAGPDVVSAAGAKGKTQFTTRHPAREGNYLEASASAMFTYALAKGVRKGYLPQLYEQNAQRAWAGFQKKFVTEAPDGTLVLHGTVKVGGLGGKPYRSGDFDYYIHETVGDQDAKGVGAFLLAGSEMEQASTEALAQHADFIRAAHGKSAQNVRRLPVTVLMDGWFNSQARKDALGGTHLFHYKWDTDSNEGDSFFGYAFESYGARLAELAAAPTEAGLREAQIYVIVSPDNAAKNPTPHYMDKSSGDAIENWVKAGGVLLLFSNDRDNTEFEHFNSLCDRFGIHFNAVLSHHVIEPDHAPGEVLIPAGTGIFGEGFKAYMKDTSTITASGPAKSVVTDKGDVMIAASKIGKGTVFAVVDPWFYNEYADGRKMGEYQGFRAAQNVAEWAIRQVTR